MANCIFKRDSFLTAEIDLKICTTKMIHQNSFIYSFLRLKLICKKHSSFPETHWYKLNKFVSNDHVVNFAGKSMKQFYIQKWNKRKKQGYCLLKIENIRFHLRIIIIWWNSFKNLWRCRFISFLTKKMKKGKKLHYQPEKC